VFKKTTPKETIHFSQLAPRLSLKITAGKLKIPIGGNFPVTFLLGGARINHRFTV
jgi:hypothetical protein